MRSVNASKSGWSGGGVSGWLVAAVLVAYGAQGAAQATPGARYSHSMAFDSARQRLVMFGGNSNTAWPGGALGDTWELDGGQIGRAHV